jgi:hypothetical protein
MLCKMLLMDKAEIEFQQAGGAAKPAGEIAAAGFA